MIVPCARRKLLGIINMVEGVNYAIIPLTCQNLAGGKVLVQLTATNPDNTPSDEPLTVKVDGAAIQLDAGGIVRLKPGMRVCIPPRTIHQFWGEEGQGITVSAEISSVCDDLEHNYFLVPSERFPEIMEDEPARYYLCGEYPS